MSLMTKDELYKIFLKKCAELKATKPYMSFADWKIANNLQDEEEQHIPILQIRPKNQRKVNATIENHTKVEG